MSSPPMAAKSWSGRKATRAQPFLLRLEEPALLAAGVAEGVIGPFGAARFDAPASYDAFRLDLAQTTPARLEARRNEVERDRDDLEEQPHALRKRPARVRRQDKCAS